MIGPSPRITNDEIAAVRARAGLVDMISRRGVKLTPKGHEHIGLCPFHKEKTPSFTVNEDKGFYHCFGCGAHGDVITFVMGFAGCSFREAVEDLHGGHGFTDPDATRRAAERQHHAEAERRCLDEKDARQRTGGALQIWRRAVPAPGTLVETYLRARGITIPVPPSLRYLAAAKHKPTGLVLPAMVAGVQGPDGKVKAVHRTFLSRDGTAKASVSDPRMSLGPVAGGAVRLAKVNGRLAVSEGIETGLSILQATGTPTWAALSATNMANVILPPDIRDVILGPDGDKAGATNAQKAARRFVDEGRAVRIAPAPKGQDFNDMLQAEARTA
jgi:DNA primase